MKTNLMNKLNNKKSGKKGFTLMEMLIVVAIIAILVAIAIPTFTNALTKAKVAADKANLRSYYSELVNQHMLDGTEYPTTTTEASKTVTIDGVDYELQAGSYTVEKVADTDTIVIKYTHGETTEYIPGSASTSASTGN